jgi:predicted RNA-binding Zn ribbon-like protein
VPILVFRGSQWGQMKVEHSLPPAVFVAGALGLDVLNSVARPVDELVDWWSDGEDFLSWMKQAGLLSNDDVAVAKAHISAKRLDRVAAEARELREWFRGFVKAHQGKPLKVRALAQLEPIQTLLATDEMFWSLEPTLADGAAAGFRLRARRRWRTPESLLAPIAEAIAAFVSSADFRHVKACAGHNCILYFLDQTRRHGRRWCSMSVCGNRAKQEAHNARLAKRKSSKKRGG